MMPKTQLFQRSLRLGVATLIPLAAIAAVGPPSAKADNNPFEVCTLELLETNLNPQATSDACAEALEPEDLSLCVLQIYELTPVDADDALRACFRARRPLDLAACTVDITQELDERDRRSLLPKQAFDPENPLNLTILDRCRSSLLPRRFAECVIGTSRKVDFSTAQILTTCIEAEAFPPSLFPQR